MTNYITHTAIAFCCMVISGSIKAQQSSELDNFHNSSSPYASASSHTNAEIRDEGHRNWVNDISTRAVADFKKRYKNVDDERWQKTETGFNASYKKDGIYSNILYSKKGNWESSLKAYTEDKLPFEVRDIVKRNYYDYTISYVREVETLLSDGVPTYMVYIHYKNLSKIIRVKNGEMDVWLELKAPGKR